MVCGVICFSFVVNYVYRWNYGKHSLRRVSMTFLQENSPVKTRDMLIGALLRVPAEAIHRRIIQRSECGGL